MFKQSKYTNLYNQLIKKAIDRNWKIKALGRERHHIIPQSLGGLNDKTNLVYLSAREHFICHWLLIKMTEGEDRNKMLYALMGMRAENSLQQRYSSRITSRVYEKYRIEHAKNHSTRMKGRKAWNKGGAELSDEQRENIRRAALNRSKPSKESIAKRVAKVLGSKRSEGTRLKMSLAAKGKLKGPMSEEQKIKRSLKQKGVPKPKGFGDKVAERMKYQFSVHNPNNRFDLQKICEHCNKMIGPTNYKRWHGDNCKKKERFHE